MTRIEGVVPGASDSYVHIILPPLVGVAGRVLDLDPLGPPGEVRLEAPLL